LQGVQNLVKYNIDAYLPVPLEEAQLMVISNSCPHQINHWIWMLL